MCPPSSHPIRLSFRGPRRDSPVKRVPRQARDDRCMGICGLLRSRPCESEDSNSEFVQNFGVVPAKAGTLNPYRQFVIHNSSLLLRHIREKKAI